MYLTIFYNYIYLYVKQSDTQSQMRWREEHFPQNLTKIVYSTGGPN